MKLFEHVDYARTHSPAPRTPAIAALGIPRLPLVQGFAISKQPGIGSIEVDVDSLANYFDTTLRLDPWYDDMVVLDFEWPYLDEHDPEARQDAFINAVNAARFLRPNCQVGLFGPPGVKVDNPDEEPRPDRPSDYARVWEVVDFVAPQWYPWNRRLLALDTLLGTPHEAKFRDQITEAQSVGLPIIGFIHGRLPGTAENIKPAVLADMAGMMVDAGITGACYWWANSEENEAKMIEELTALKSVSGIEFR